MKVKVKVLSIYPLFSNMEGEWRGYRSCGVVRSIMSPARGDDPGSNPGTSTKISLSRIIMILILVELTKIRRNF